MDIMEHCKVPMVICFDAQNPAEATRNVQSAELFAKRHSG
jgi:hypothetical protein